MSKYFKLWEGVCDTLQVYQTSEKVFHNKYAMLQFILIFQSTNYFPMLFIKFLYFQTI